jgi:hypothetical protein
VSHRTFTLTAAEADVVFHALRYYASELLEAFVQDDESPTLDDARHAQEIAGRLQEWIVANRQSLTRDISG